MKKLSAILLLLLAVIPARAQYAAVAADPAAVPAVEAPSGRGAEACFLAGVGLMAAGFAGGALVQDMAAPSKALSIASEAALVGGAATAATGALLLFCREIPSYRIGYCSRYVPEAVTAGYVRGATAAKALMGAGAGLLGAGLGTYLCMYHGGGALGGGTRIYGSMECAGMAMMLAGAVVAVVADSRYYDEARTSFRRRGCPPATLSLGGTRHGVGLAYAF